MTSSSDRERVRWIEFSRSSRGEREYEIRRRLKTEGKDAILERKVRTSQRELIEMAHVVAAQGTDPREFLRLFKQDAAEFDLDSAAVYPEDLSPDEKWAYDFELTEIERLAEICCEASTCSPGAVDHSSVDDAESAIERLGEFCTVFETAVEIELPPLLYQG